MSTDPNKIIYSMMRVSKFYDKKPVIKDISLSYFYGAKIGVLGLNGSGKSTLLKIMAGVDTEFNGEAILSKGYTIGYLEQEPLVDETKTIREVVQEGVQEAVDLVDEFNRINERFAEPMSDDDMDKLIQRQGEVQEKLDALDAWDLDARLEMAMDALRCPPGDTPVNVISGGERRRVALCRLLLKKPDILLLDEPTNHLDAESVAWLEQHLQQYAGTIIAVTHDRYFLDNVAGWILELDRGHGIPWKGNYSSWLEQKQNRLANEEKSESDRQKTLKRELEWIRMAPKGRRAKSKARITSYEKLLDQENERLSKELEIYIPPGPRLGNRGDPGQGRDQRIRREAAGGKHGIFPAPRRHRGSHRPNGAGKTTLFRMITGQDQPDSGSIAIGETVSLAYVDQSRDVLDPEKNIWEMVSDGQDTIELGDRQVNSRAYVARFNFSGSDQQKKVGVLSGGERNRVHLARMLKSGANVLLLDEPTNDLDVNTMRALEEALENFGGCAVVISHDRWFLDRIATHMLAFEGNSQVVWFEGNYSDYEKDRKNRLGCRGRSAPPHQIPAADEIDGYPAFINQNGQAFMEKIRTPLKPIVRFFTTTIWHARRGERSAVQWLLIRLVRTLVLTVRGFSRHQGPLRASALTFFTLLSLVPVAAMAFGIAKGFGFERRLQQELLDKFSAQEEVVEQVIGFAQNMLDNTKGGMIAGIGIVVLFWAVVKVLGNIENAFNHIWGVRSRTFIRKLSDYLTIMLICPVLVIMSGSVTVFITSQVSAISGRFELLQMVGPAIFVGLKLLPYTLIWVLFTLTYMIMPNTRVRFDGALLAGVIAGSAYQVSRPPISISRSSWPNTMPSTAALPPCPCS
jgi:sulfate-transporting ATPase